MPVPSLDPLQVPGKKSHRTLYKHPDLLPCAQFSSYHSIPLGPCLVSSFNNFTRTTNPIPKCSSYLVEVKDHPIIANDQSTWRTPSCQRQFVAVIAGGWQGFSRNSPVHCHIQSSAGTSSPFSHQSRPFIHCLLSISRNHPGVHELPLHVDWIVFSCSPTDFIEHSLLHLRLFFW